MLEFRIDGDHAGVRLDKVLRQRLPRVPASHLQKMIRTKKVRVNGKRATPDQPLAEGDVLTVRGDERALTGEAPVPPRAPSAEEVGRLRILHEDEWVMAVDKPSGLAVHTGSGITGGTLVDLVRAALGPRAERNGFSASPAHRLDRETSGVIVVAKRRPAMVHFTEVFTHGGARKQYLTLAKGTFPRAEGRIDLPLSEHQQTAESKARRGVNMQEAVTRWRVLRQGGEAALLEVTLETGRTHQIRRHLAAIGHPVAGDRKYGDFAFNREVRARWGLKRLFLHAERLEVPHPETKAPLRLRSPLPSELEDVLRRAGIEFLVREAGGPRTPSLPAGPREPGRAAAVASPPTGSPGRGVAPARGTSGPREPPGAAGGFRPPGGATLDRRDVRRGPRVSGPPRGRRG